MKNLNISNVPNSVLVAISIKELYFWSFEDYGKEMLKIVTRKDEELFKKFFDDDKYFFDRGNVEVCNMAINYAEFLLKNDVKDRLATLRQTLNAVEKEGNISSEIKNLEQEEHILYRFDKYKQKFLKEINSIGKKFNDSQTPYSYSFFINKVTNPFVVSDSSVVSEFHTYYIEGKKKWEEVDERLDNLKRELSATATNGV